MPCVREDGGKVNGGKREMERGRGGADEGEWGKGGWWKRKLGLLHGLIYI